MLAQIQQDERLRDIPIVVFTGRELTQEERTAGAERSISWDGKVVSFQHMFDYAIHERAAAGLLRLGTPAALATSRAE